LLKIFGFGGRTALIQIKECSYRPKTRFFRLIGFLSSERMLIGVRPDCSGTRGEIVVV
jgi:hypothetical protein